jgi:hypothetical protein
METASRESAWTSRQRLVTGSDASGACRLLVSNGRQPVNRTRDLKLGGVDVRCCPARERSEDAGIELFAPAVRAIYITADKGEHHADTNLPAR